ncbi:hypothetical protein ACFL2Q_03695 [Thermodesulfobacteriota bacterium]
MKKSMTLKRLRRLLTQVFNRPIPMTVLTDPDRSGYTPDEVSKITLDAYLLGLMDVLDAIKGDSEGLAETLTQDGKAVVVDVHEKVFVRRVPKQDVILKEVSPGSE